jgi:predicted metalloprotease with PDZ domain
MARLEEDRLVAQYVVAGSPAAMAGIAPEDEIVEIDGIAFAPGRLLMRLKQVQRKPAGAHVRIKLADSREFAIELAD